MELEMAKKHKPSEAQHYVDVERLTDKLRGPLTFKQLRGVNTFRCVHNLGFDHPLDAWMIDQWANAMQGEAGEAGNFAKKISRIRHLNNARVNKPNERDETKLLKKMAREVAGLVIYADLLLASEGIDLDDVIRKEFNAKSKEIGYPGAGL